MNNMKIQNVQRSIKPVIIEENSFPIIIASTGMSTEKDILENELHKAEIAIEAGANIITDHSLTEDTEKIHKIMIEKLNVPISAIAIYEGAVYARSKNYKINIQDLIGIIEKQAQRGLDLITIHATTFLEDIILLKNSGRIIPCTSRGGTMMLEIMQKTKHNNPFWENFDELINIAKKYRVTYSLGTSYRPASVCDCDNNELYYLEMRRMGQLVQRARSEGINLIVEGIGHAPIDKIPKMIKKSKEICLGAPYRVLTVATDIALGFDHISSAIASAIAVYSGADMITSVTRSEHIGLPTLDDVKEAVIAARVAAHCGFIARTNNLQRDALMSHKRNQIGCYGQVDAAINPEEAKKTILSNKIKGGKKSCSMCGEFCALEANERLLK